MHTRAHLNTQITHEHESQQRDLPPPLPKPPPQASNDSHFYRSQLCPAGSLFWCECTHLCYWRGVHIYSIRSKQCISARPWQCQGCMEEEGAGGGCTCFTLNRQSQGVTQKPVGLLWRVANDAEVCVRLCLPAQEKWETCCKETYSLDCVVATQGIDYLFYGQLADTLLLLLIHLR